MELVSPKGGLEIWASDLIRHSVFVIRHLRRFGVRFLIGSAGKMHGSTLGHRRLAGVFLLAKTDPTTLGGNLSWRRGLQARRLFHYFMPSAFGVRCSLFDVFFNGFYRQDAGSTSLSKEGWLESSGFAPFLS